MTAEKVMEAELSRFDWSAMDCACGHGGSHLPADFRRLATARTKAEARIARLSDHLLIESFPQEPAVAATSVLTAMLLQGLSHDAKLTCLHLLLALVDNDNQEMSEECRAIVRNGLWLFYAELAAGRAPSTSRYAYEILRCVETDPTRMSDYVASGRFLLKASWIAPESVTPAGAATSEGNKPSAR